MSEKDDYIKSLKDNLKNFDQKVDEFAKKIKELSGRAKDEALLKLKEIKIERKDIDNFVNKLQSTAAESWKELKGKAEKTCATLKSKIEQLTKKQ
jgi:hypothetical protein